MKIPTFPPTGEHISQTAVFGGVNQRPAAAEGEMTDSINLSSRLFPSLTVREARRKISDTEGVALLAAPLDGEFAFTGVCGDKFYYAGEEVAGSVEGAPESFVRFKENLLMFPNMQYVNLGAKNKKVNPMAEPNSDGADIRVNVGSLTVKSDVFYREQMYPGERVAIVDTVRPQNTTTPFEHRGITTQANYYATFVKTGEYSYSTGQVGITIQPHYMSNDSPTFFPVTTPDFVSGIYFSRELPQIDYAAAHKNRLWAVNKGGKNIFASRLGSFNQFFYFSQETGTTDNSYILPVTSDGPFTGIAAFGDKVFAFKRDIIHVIYGDRPQNFSMITINGGCIDHRSIAEVGGALYWLGVDGFYRFNGAWPQRVSNQITENISEAIATGYGEKYYAGANGKIFTFDTAREIWQIESGSAEGGFAKFDGGLYLAGEDGIYKAGGGDEPVSWHATFPPFTGETLSKKRLIGVSLRLSLGEGAAARLYAKVGGGDFALFWEGSGEGLKTVRVPLRLALSDSAQLRLEGEGAATILSLERRYKNT